VGQWSLQSNTTGWYNSAQGQSSLSWNTTGSFNSAYGNTALSQNTTGGNNTALWYSSFYSNKAWNNGVAIGYSSQYYTNDTTTAWDNTNTSVWYNSLRGSTTAVNNTGVQNTAIGRDSILNNTTGTSNSTIGYQALYSNTTWNVNGAIWSLALWNNTIGSGNSASWYRALFDTTSGNNNTALWYNTWWGITTGSNNTILWANVTWLPVTLSNNIIIADGAGNRRINVDNTGNVGIWVPNPNTRFQINSTTTTAWWTVDTNSTTTVTTSSDLSSVISIWDTINICNTAATICDYRRVTAITATTITTDTALSFTDTLRTLTYSKFRFNITNAGNVGIGTTSPSSKFQIIEWGNQFSTELWLSWDIRSRYIPDPANKYRFWLTENTGVFWMSIWNASWIMLSGGDTSYRNVIASVLDDFAIYTWGTTNANAIERLRITAGGNVGIGTNSPWQKLTVAWTIETTSGWVKFPDSTIQTTAGWATNVTTINATVVDAWIWVAWNYSSYVSCPVWKTLIMKALKQCNWWSWNTYQYCTCEASWNSMRAWYLSWSNTANWNYNAICEWVCMQ
jgi:hypothetical protein